MPDGNVDAPFLQHGIKSVEKSGLTAGTAQIVTVCSGKVTEESFRDKTGKVGNPGAQIG